MILRGLFEHLWSDDRTEALILYVDVSAGGELLDVRRMVDDREESLSAGARSDVQSSWEDNMGLATEGGLSDAEAVRELLSDVSVQEIRDLEI